MRRFNELNTHPGALGLRSTGGVPFAHIDPGPERNLNETKIHTLCEHKF